MKAIVLAAGKGTRLGTLTQERPKPMVPIAGKPLLEYNIQLLRRHGIQEIAMNVHHCPDVIQKHFGDGDRWGVRVTYSWERELLGTAGAVKRLEHFFSDRVLVLYGDNLTNCDLTELIAFHERKGGIAALAVHWREDPTPAGVVEMDEDRHVRCFVEKPGPLEVNSHWVSAGILVLERRALDYIAPDLFCDFGLDVFPRLLDAGESLYAYQMTEALLWVDTPQDYARANRFVVEGRVNLA